MSYKATRVALLGALLFACSPSPPPNPPVPYAPGEDGGYPITTEPDSADNEDPEPGKGKFPACSKACAKLKELGCPEGERKKGEKTCYALCRDAEDSGKYTLKPQCVADASSVDSVRACKTVKCAKK